MNIPRRAHPIALEIEALEVEVTAMLFLVRDDPALATAYRSLKRKLMEASASARRVSEMESR